MKDLEFKSYPLGDINVIELLISYRYKYDDNLFKGESTIMDVEGVGRVNEEVIATYVDLDSYIKRCKFDDIQLKVIEMIEHGYTHDEIAEELEVKSSVIKGRLKTIYKRIKKENDWQWRKSLYLNELGLKSKTCSKCSEKLPGTVEFYSNLAKTKDGFHSQCRMCKG